MAGLLRPGLDEPDCLRVQLLVNEEAVLLAAMSTTEEETHPPVTENDRENASAAAVPSSRSDALEWERPVMSEIMVWKFTSDSRRPWATSAW